jgi:DEAD_2
VSSGSFQLPILLARRSILLHDELTRSTATATAVFVYSGCEWLHSGGQRQYRDAALATVQDIEELAELGHELHVCPYYGTRKVLLQYYAYWSGSDTLVVL